MIKVLHLNSITHNKYYMNMIEERYFSRSVQCVHTLVYIIDIWDSSVTTWMKEWSLMYILCVWM